MCDVALTFLISALQFFILDDDDDNTFLCIL